MKSIQEQQQPNSMDSSDSGTTTGSSEYAYRPLTTKHRRAGSTGTTGDEEYTTDEDELYGDETDCTAISSGFGHHHHHHHHHTTHPILKSDLARAATDLFGYAKGDEEDLEPTSLFDEDEAGFCRENSNKLISIFTYSNDNPRLPRNVLTRRRSDGNAKSATSTKPTTFDCQKNKSLQNSTSDRRASLAEEKLSVSERRCNDEICPTKEVITRKSDSNDDDTTTTKTGQKEPSNESEKTSIVINTAIKNNEDEGKSDDNGPLSPSTIQWSRAIAEVKEQAISKLQEELHLAHEELKLKDEEVSRLSRIRQDVEAELEELTASLFQEAHNMVREANQRQATAERLLEESRMKSEVLAAEVSALKTLVLTSTPARPNPHLHPQIACNGFDDSHYSQQSSGIFAKKHRRSPSHFNLKYGRENSPPDSPQKESRTSLPYDQNAKDAYERDPDKDRERDKDKKRETRDRDKDSKDLGLEVDPRVHSEFLMWKANPCVDKSDPFVARIFREDIDLCLDFPNAELGAKVRQAVLDGIIFVEAVSDKAKIGFPKKCALLEAPRQCHYRMRMGDQENQWHSISQICRNRIIAVCDFLNYLRYIERGLVKSKVHDVYWEITRLRKEMVLARLGLALSV